MKLFAIFGNPVSHSKSPLMHNMVFKNLGIKACYTRVLLEDGDKLKEKFLSLGLSGANITVPHKEAAFMVCDEVRGFAKKVGVINTIVLEDNKLIGYNPDADGFMFAISEFSDIKKILVLGAGGTAKALTQKFLDENIKVEVLNRSKSRLEFFKEIGAITYSWDDFKISSYDLVLNTTSAGLSDENLPAPKKIIDNVLNNTRYAADAIYGKLTPFLKEASLKNILYKDGADMLLGQGVLANELFINKAFKREDILNEMKKAFLL
jgi:shikimate dehydrogenase